MDRERILARGIGHLSVSTAYAFGRVLGPGKFVLDTPESFAAALLPSSLEPGEVGSRRRLRVTYCTVWQHHAWWKRELRPGTALTYCIRELFPGPFWLAANPHLNTGPNSRPQL